MQLSPLVLQALQKRQQELAQGGGQAPQVPAPQNAGVPQAPQNPANAPQQAPQMPTPQDQAGMSQAGQQAQSPQFGNDEEVKMAAKVLIAKLLKHI
jgi:hypothetical protein